VFAPRQQLSIGVSARAAPCARGATHYVPSAQPGSVDSQQVAPSVCSTSLITKQSSQDEKEETKEGLEMAHTPEK